MSKPISNTEKDVAFRAALLLEISF